MSNAIIIYSEHYYAHTYVICLLLSNPRAQGIQILATTSYSLSWQANGSILNCNVKKGSTMPTSKFTI